MEKRHLTRLITLGRGFESRPRNMEKQQFEEKQNKDFPKEEFSLPQEMIEKTKEEIAEIESSLAEAEEKLKTIEEERQKMEEMGRLIKEEELEGKYREYQNLAESEIQDVKKLIAALENLKGRLENKILRLESIDRILTITLKNYKPEARA